MTFARYALFGLALVGTPAALAATLDVNLSDHAAQIGYRTALTQTGLHGDLGVLHHEEDGDLLSAGLHLVDDAVGGREPFTVGLGGRLYFVDTDANLSGSALALGAFFRYVVPNYNRFALGGNLHYAPGVTSFGDADKFYELGLRAEYRVLRRASVYVGVRRVRMDFEGAGSASIDRGINVGIGIEF
jgi:hypothetical protein